MLFYFVRHGQTLANAQRIIAGGGQDYPLIDEGHRQAELLASVFKGKVDQEVHRLVASNLRRTQETGTYLSRVLGLPLETVNDLREWELGEWEGLDYATCTPLILGSGDPPGGETRKTFYARVEAAWRTLHDEKKAYVMVSHGGVWMALQDILQIPRFKIDNCQLVRGTCYQGVWRAEIIA